MQHSGFLLFLGFTFVLVLDNSAASAQECGQVSDDTLQMAITLFRHGDRTPYSTYPNDPYQESFWAPWGGFSGLTQLGESQLFDLGLWFRQCYQTFINATYSEYNVFVRSTDKSRTLMSAQAYLAGLYPPEGFQVWGSHPVAKLWQAIPVHTVRADEDFLLRSTISCPPYNEMVENVWRDSTLIKDIQQNNQHLLNFIAEHAGLSTPGSIRDVNYYLSDSIFVETVHNLTLPAWINSTVQDAVLGWYDLWLYAETASSDEMVKLCSGPLVSNIIQLLTERAEGRSNEKLIVYSTHESTLVPLLAAFGYDDINGPAYAASMTVELHNNVQNGWWVRVFYRNDTSNDPYQIEVRSSSGSCREPCRVADFVKTIESFSMDDKESVCFPPKGSAETPNSFPIIAMLLLVSGTWALLMQS